MPPIVVGAPDREARVVLSGEHPIVEPCHNFESPNCLRFPSEERARAFS